MFALIFVICCQSLSILTKAFTGLLLETYFSIKYVPIVNNLDEVHKNTELGIAGNSDHLGRLQRNSMDAEILKRMKLYSNQTRYNYVLDEFRGKFFKEVVLGKAVMLISSGNIEYYTGQYQEWKDRFHISDDMYLPEFSNLVISRKHKLAKKVKY